ncbi:hypothetical protein [Actinomadura rubrisoli]|uniref:Head-tail adaptor protein n=1 Tax=Actinomadura rubrisoli TaxID=2530368 RepID=A0A4R5BY43_9ACTN|nr:hypothetical protein [Actinomadura rubrisoli]TDD90776.1 hypothetical protein E1298_12810 [Actinomadura rubrisoli]
MSTIPRWALVHRVVIEPYEGEGATGAVYAAPVPGVRALVEAKTRYLRSADGHRTVSDTTVYMLPGTNVPARSRLTLPGGRKVIAMAIADHTAPGLPTPDHLEAVCA